MYLLHEMKARIALSFKLILMTGLCVWLSGCAVVHSKSNKDAAYHTKIDRVAVWSGITGISYLSGPLKPSTPFPEAFQHGLMDAFAKHKVEATYADTKPMADMSPDEVQKTIKSESEIPSTRLMISVKQTSTTRHAGFTHLDMAVFDLSLYSTVTNQRVWRAEIAVDSSLDVPKWGEGTANKFVSEIFVLLKKDGLI